MSQDTSLSGRVCIVAGGAHGMGEVAARALADHGATVVVNDRGTSVEGEGEDPEAARDVARSIREAGGDATAHFGDVSAMATAESLVEGVVDDHGRLDCVANFANVLRDGYATNLTETDWDEVIRVNLRANFTLFRSAARHWRREADGGALSPQRSFLAATSESAFGSVGQLNYSAAKAGVLGFVHTASTELYETGVRVNALIPAGFTRATETVPEGKRPYTREEMPAEKTGPMVAFLASDAAADVTGLTLYAGGNRVGIYSAPELERQGVSPGGWTVESLADSFDDVADGVELTRTGEHL